MQKDIVGIVPASDLISRKQPVGAKLFSAATLVGGTILIFKSASIMSNVAVKGASRISTSVMKNNIKKNIVGKTTLETVDKSNNIILLTGGIIATSGAVIEGYGAMLQLCANMIPSTSHKYIINKYDTNGNLIKQH